MQLRASSRRLRLSADGNANKEIANELGISERTVKTHLGHLFEKLGVTSRVRGRFEQLLG